MRNPIDRTKGGRNAFPYRSIAIVAVIGLVASCAGDPEIFPAPPFVPVLPQPPIVEPVPPPPVEEPAPVPPEATPTKPLGHAPLVGTTWNLDRLYGDMRALAPVDGPSWIEFAEDGTVFIQGPANQMEGSFFYAPDVDSPRDADNFEEGVLEGDGIARDRRPGSFSEFEDVLLENLQLLKGYYIRGETPEESKLTIWGGYRSEEVVLMELSPVPEAGR